MEQIEEEIDIGRIFATALRIFLVSSQLGQTLERTMKELDHPVLSFVYGSVPIECVLHENCPMRFQTEDMRLKHYEETIIDDSDGNKTIDSICDGSQGADSRRLTLQYQCRSCLRSNRRMRFSSKTDLMNHKRNPALI